MNYIPWGKINDHRYFAWGLQPQDEFTKSPIPCPDYCHKYHLLFKKIAELEQRKEFHEGGSKQKEEYFVLWGQLSDIRREDPEAISWKFFQMPEVKSHINKLKDLLAGVVFDETAVDEIRQRIPTLSVFFPDLNIDRLKYYAGRWAGTYPCIKQIVLYKAGYDHAVDYVEPPSEEDIKLGLVSPLPEKNEDYQTKYIIAVTLLNKTDKYLEWVNENRLGEGLCECDHVSDLLPQCYCSPDGNPSYEEIMHHWLWVTVGPGENIFDYDHLEIDSFIDGYRNEVLYSHEEKVKELGTQAHIPPAGQNPSENEKFFPELNLPHLKTITKRWVKHYQKNRVEFSQITLYRYASSLAGSKIKTTYAIVFDISHYEPRPLPGPGASIQDCIDDIAASSKSPYSPYSEFINRDIGYNSMLIKGLPEKFDSGDFRVVYNPPRTDDGYKLEWELIPLYKGFVLPEQVRTDEPFVVLYGLSLEQKSLAETILFSQDGFIHSVPEHNSKIYHPFQKSKDAESSSIIDGVKKRMDKIIKEGASSIENQLNLLLKTIGPEFEQLYLKFTEIVASKDMNISSVSNDSELNEAHKGLKNPLPFFIQKKMLQGINYPQNDKNTREIRGTILQNIVREYLPEAFSTKGLSTSKQGLERRLNQLKTIA